MSKPESVPENLREVIRKNPEDAKKLRKDLMGILNELNSESFIGIAMFGLKNVEKARREIYNLSEETSKQEKTRNETKASSHRGKENDGGSRRGKEIEKHLSKVEKKYREKYRRKSPERSHRRSRERSDKSRK